MTRLIVAFGLSLGLLSGCASTDSTSESQGATHYWESTASKKQYHSDHSNCEAVTQVDADGELDPNSASFDAYRDCMIEQGYTLRRY